jgi:hypothetical protein
MSLRPEQVPIYHITDVTNLPGILAENGLHSDVAMASRNPTVIGYEHIKKRRMEEIRVACCDGRFVGEFVPFYYCPRSPMLLSINSGRTGRAPGCQKTIIHLVSSVEAGIALNRAWAISDGNAGAAYPSFYADLKALDGLDWDAIRATYWQGRTNQKMAEFLVADFFPWTGFQTIVCHNSVIANDVQNMLTNHNHRPEVIVKPGWYY